MNRVKDINLWNSVIFVHKSKTNLFGGTIEENMDQYMYLNIIRQRQ